MAECRTILQGTRLRATRLNECGEIAYGECAYVVTKCFATVTLTQNIEAPDEFKQKTAGGEYCFPPQRSDPLLNWIEVSAELQQVDPELFELLTGSPLVLDDSTPVQAIGFGVDTDSFASTFFALELWTNLAKGTVPCPAGQPRYGYLLLPFVYQGQIGDLTIENGPINFTISSITSAGNAWGVGPYDVLLDNTGTPSPLLEAIPITRHQHMQFTSLAPPEPVCGCQALAAVS